MKDYCKFFNDGNNGNLNRTELMIKVMGKDKFVLIGKIKKGDFKRFMEIASVLREFDMHNPNVEILEAEILEDLKKEHIHKNNIKNKWGGNYILLYNNNYTPFAPQSPIIEKYLGNMGRFLRLTC